MNKKTIFLDLDGTLLNEQKKISETNQKAMNAALEAGHSVVIATGRAFASAREFCKKAGFERPGFLCVCYNGGLIFECDTHKVLYEQTMDKSIALEIMKICREEGVHVQTYSDNYVVAERDCEGLQFYLGKCGMGGDIVESFETSLTWNPDKVLACDVHNKVNLERIRDRVSEKLGDQIEQVFSCDEYLEFLPKNVSKGNGIKQYCKLKNIAIADTIAAGDEENDLQMIETVGLGCAMKNATDSVKAVADYITEHDNNEDGVAEIIEKFMLS